MPFIEEEKFKLMQEDLNNAKIKSEEAETALANVKEELNTVKKNSKNLPIFLGLLFGLALGAAVYFYLYGGNSAINNIDVEAVKKEEAHRVIDSISRAQARAERNNVTNNGASVDVDAAADDVALAVNGQTIYSVQIGVLSEKKYPLLSTEVIPSTVTTNEGYFKYSLGLFKTLEEAKELKKELVKLGFKDAFVASYIDGERQKIHN